MGGGDAVAVAVAEPAGSEVSPADGPPALPPLSRRPSSPPCAAAGAHRLHAASPPPPPLHHLAAGSAIGATWEAGAAGARSEDRHGIGLGCRRARRALCTGKAQAPVFVGPPAHLARAVEEAVKRGAAEGPRWSRIGRRHSAHARRRRREERPADRMTRTPFRLRLARRHAATCGRSRARAGKWHAGTAIHVPLSRA